MRLLSFFVFMSFISGVKAQSDYYSSSAYLNSVRARANQTFTNGVANIQQMMANGMREAQRSMERINQANVGLIQWSNQFERQNGRPPYETEKDQWMAQYFPDVYPVYIQTKYSDGTITSSRNTPCMACHQTGQCSCTRDGHPGQQISYMSIGRSNPVYTKHSYCNGTGKCPACDNGYIK